MRSWRREHASLLVVHAGSSTHLAVLTSDSAWQLYHAADFGMPEQRFVLRLAPRRRAFSALPDALY